MLYVNRCPIYVLLFSITIYVYICPIYVPIYVHLYVYNCSYICLSSGASSRKKLFFLVQLLNHKIPQCYFRRRGLQPAPSLVARRGAGLPQALQHYPYKGFISKWLIQLPTLFPPLIRDFLVYIHKVLCFEANQYCYNSVIKLSNMARNGEILRDVYSRHIGGIIFWGKTILFFPQALAIRYYILRQINIIINWYICIYIYIYI